MTSLNAANLTPKRAWQTPLLIDMMNLGNTYSGASQFRTTEYTFSSPIIRHYGGYGTPEYSNTYSIPTNFSFFGPTS